MFIFAAVVIIGGLIGAASAVVGIVKGMGEALSPEIPTFEVPESVASNNVEQVRQEKKNLTPNGESIVGLKDPSITVNATGVLTTTTFDTTTYGDRAIVKLTNATGSSINLTGLCIKGKPVMQLAGQNGYVWEYSDYDAIEKEGEQFVEVSNDFIFDPVQAKQIGDFVWKELKPHKLYSLMLIGCQYQYEIGDVYHLTLEHTMNGGTMENIDTDVEVMGVSINRSVGGVGMTNLNLRVPSEAWALTLARNSKLVGAGNAQRLNNRSNVVTVASSTWTGQADYFCDGTDDNVEIQAAIDYVFSLGGGEVALTSGAFYSSSGVVMKSYISLHGTGNDTIIYSLISNFAADISATSETSFIQISSLVLDASMVSNRLGIGISTSGIFIAIHDVEIREYHSNSNSKFGASVGWATIYNCYIHDISSTNGQAVGIVASSGSDGRIYYNIIENISGSTTGYGFVGGRKMQQNRVTNASTAKYFGSYADSGASYPCDDTASGGYNS